MAPGEGTTASAWVSQGKLPGGGSTCIGLEGQMELSGGRTGYFKKQK